MVAATLDTDQNFSTHIVSPYYSVPFSLEIISDQYFIASASIAAFASQISSFCSHKYDKIQTKKLIN